MNKPYSTKALPSGTILREWRLEQVLGVGGFGIVYRGRGIYFDELVAIKEYFPSAISERRDGDTVVPIDSDAEELHALGLKKFVEEAKLLWNLSTPTRHPNIVSVRSLFEIHGTAYMVMDFEDGVSLSRMIKDGKKFTEAELLDLVRPIAEGLERAHRVGVLHRDIKPPNILMNDDGRPVLIDFGSARFDAGRATSTTVTFHTPPYAAIEQYVKTYDQGPWTDIYALGVVLYECVTGEKPPEVLERLHGGLGSTLADGDWPGYSQRTLQAIDAAMTIRPGDRPQSISDWLRMFDEDYTGPAPMPLPEIDEDATQVATFVASPKPIVPVNAPAEGVEQLINAEPPVPDTASQASFKLAGVDTGAWPRTSGEAEKAKLETADPAGDREGEGGEPVVPAPVAGPAAGADVEAVKPAKPEGSKPPAAAKDEKKARKGGVSAMNVGVIGLGAVAIFVGGFFWAQSNKGTDAPTPIAAPVAMEAGVDVSAVSGLSVALIDLGKEARNAGVSNALAIKLDNAGEALKGEYENLAIMAADKAGPDALNEHMATMQTLATTSLNEFASGLLDEAQTRSRSLARQAAWTTTRGPTPTGATEKKLAAQLASSREALTGSTAAVAKAASVEEALETSRAALKDYAQFSAAANQAVRLARSDTPDEAAASSPGVTETVAAEPAAFDPAANVRQFDAIMASSREAASKVIAMGDGKKPGSKATDQEKANYDLRRDNAKRASDYMAYMDKLSGDIRKAESAAVANDVIAQANKYKGYLMVLLSRSTAAN
ncbi:serine/threonine protein kinase [Croceicoccus bisphenolivorans]|uniref:serine/threonine protein kinase n=1 Tax=Croceicoccus bisphenolivorans TaxID=1783232 RepID=UPI00082D8298|nr:serine/threonine-protein kinase [Croceicoccus bisphenolivorans]